ncbi:MAG: DUF4105 domain-containing protein [Planctomycetes bacterium]|nr:DUF4105 domain-containing protein [Planctomycetota bacterium]
MSDVVEEWMLSGLMLAISASFTLWITGAIYFDVAHGHRWGKPLSLLWIIGVVSLLVVWQPLWQPFAVVVSVSLLFIGLWLLQKPRHDRDWDPSVALLPRAVRCGDVVTIENVRNFEYRSLTDFTPRYQTRITHLANLRHVDIIFFNWGSPWMSHPVLVFDFGPDGRVCCSIEVRYRKGQEFSILRSLYRQQELIILIADERDVILRRTKHSPNQIAHLYRLNASVEETRTAFLDYVAAINDLYEKPRWYHGLCMNCTTTFFRLPNSRFRLDWRVFANARLDRALYESGQLDHSLPFDELRRVSRINDIANNAPEDGFGDHLRNELEKRHHER